MNSASAVLLSNASADGSWVPWPGGAGHFSMAGTFGGTSAQLEYKGPDNSTAIAVQAMAPDGTLTAVPLTAAGGFCFDLPPCHLRVNLTGGSPSGLYATAARIPE